MMSEYKVIYIAGYSRSGSTILDTLLGDAPDCFGCGEIIYLSDELEHERQCSCQESYDKCSVWSDIVKTSLRLDYTEINKALDGRVKEGSKYSKAEYEENNLEVFDAIARKTGSQFLVDSSKSARDAAYRIRNLYDLYGSRLYVIHITRHLHSVMSSYYTTGSNWAAEGYIKEKPFRVERAAIGWRLANQLVMQQSKDIEDLNYIRLKLESLTESPIYSLTKLEKFTGLDLSRVKSKVEMSEEILPGHKVGGNRNRFKPLILSSGKASGGKALPLRYRIIGNLLCGGLLKKLGY